MSQPLQQRAEAFYLLCSLKMFSFRRHKDLAGLQGKSCSHMVNYEGLLRQCMQCLHFTNV